MQTVLTFSEAGGHPDNQDVVLVRQHPARSDLTIALVADGQGGQSGGGRAAELACQTAWQLASEFDPDRLLDPLVWAYLLRQVDSAVEKDATAGFTTLVALGVSPNRVVGVASGDSVAIAVVAGSATELTVGQPKNPPVGSGVAIGRTFNVPLEAPWRVALMTDGVWKFADLDRVLVLAQKATPNDLLAELQTTARRHGTGDYHDDFTLAVIDNDGRL